MTDIEKADSLSDAPRTHVLAASDDAIVPTRWHQKLLKFGVETQGLSPVPSEERTDTGYWKLFVLWASLSTNLLPLVTGHLATAVYGLSLRDAFLTILFFTILCTIPPAWATSLGPKFGMRTMIFSRYSWGREGVALPAILNALTLFGWAVVSCILAGQTLATVSDGSLSWTVGIVIIAVIAMCVAFFGHMVLHRLEQVSVVLGLIAIITAVGAGGSHLSDRVPTETATSYPVLSFGGILAGFLLTWTAIVFDYTTRYGKDAPTQRLFWYQYMGLGVPTCLFMTLGAAIGSAIGTSETWTAGYEANGIPGVLREMLRPAGGWGAFCAVLFALSLLGNLSATVYSLGFSIQVAIPPLIRVPRYIFILVATAVMIPVAIVGAKRFFTALESFLGVVGFWSAGFVAILVVEHFVFRKNNVANYDQTAWNTRHLLTTGLPAIAAFLCSWALIVPCMAQVWYEGPIGAKIGDFGFEAGFFVSGLLYIPFRWIEINRFGRN